jgi:hypothetical protein
MFDTTHNGHAPGANTPIEKAPGTTNPKGLMTDHNSADSRSHRPIQQVLDGNKTTRLTLAYTRIKDVLTGFYLDRAISLEAIAALIMLAVFVTVRAFQ